MHNMESRAVGSREKVVVLSSKMLLPANALTSAREVPNHCYLGTNFYRESSTQDNCFDAVRVQDLADLAFYENVMKAVPNDLWCGQGSNVSDEGVSSSYSSLLHPKSVHGEDESSSKVWYPVTASYAQDPSVIDSSEHSRVSSSSVSNVPMKRIRPTSLNGTPVCQVNDCNMDLTSSKSYNKRHKVCEVHSKIEKVTVNGVEQRFCQQCSRFHLLSEFDESKRSCRKRLSGHNERRRKPQPSFDYGKTCQLLGTIIPCRSPFSCPDMLPSSIVAEVKYDDSGMFSNFGDEKWVGHKWATNSEYLPLFSCC